MWKKDFVTAKKAQEKHDRSKRHKEAVLKQTAFSSTANVGTQLNAEHLKTQSHHQMLLKLISSIRFWACHCLSL